MLEAAPVRVLINRGGPAGSAALRWLVYGAPEFSRLPGRIRVDVQIGKQGEAPPLRPEFAAEGLRKRVLSMKKGR